MRALLARHGLGVLTHLASRGTRARPTSAGGHVGRSGVAGLRAGRAPRLQTSRKRVGLPLQTSRKRRTARNHAKPDETTHAGPANLRGASSPFASLRRQLATSGRTFQVGFLMRFSRLLRSFCGPKSRAVETRGSYVGHGSLAVLRRAAAACRPSPSRTSLIGPLGHANQRAQHMAMHRPAATPTQGAREQPARILRLGHCVCIGRRRRDLLQFGDLHGRRAVERDLAKSRHDPFRARREVLVKRRDGGLAITGQDLLE